MEHFPELITRQLSLRRMQQHDLASLMRYVNDPVISDQILNIPYPYTETDAIARFNLVLQGFRSRERYIFAMTLRGENELIGEIGLHLDKANNSAQFGYWVASHLRGRGLATEAAGALLKFGFETLDLQKIYATHYPENPASGKVMLKNGMIREGELKDHYKVGDSYRSVIQYRLTREEWGTLRSGADV